MKTLTALVLVLVTPLLLWSAILSVPFGYDNIQAAINAANVGDTVLIEPADVPYFGKIDFKGKRITVGGHYLLNGNPETIARTVLTGGWYGPIVTFGGNNQNQATLAGLVLQQGKPDSSRDGVFLGGAMYINGENPILDGVTFYDNVSKYKYVVDRGGAGIYCNNGDPVIRNCTFQKNSTTATGGAIYALNGSDLTIENSTFLDNMAEGNNSRGGAIFVGSNSTLKMLRSQFRGNIGVGAAVCFETNSNTVSELRNITLAGNGAFNNLGVLDMRDGPVKIVNSIIWQNAPYNVSSSNNAYADNLAISYSDVKDGQVKISLPAGKLSWGNGNISDDPRFFDFNTGDYRLQADSPCIDAGDPAGNKDPDETTADMGMFYTTQTGTLWGVVTTGDDPPEPIVFASVTTSLGQSVFTDERGYYLIDPANLGKFNVTFDADGFSDTTVMNVTLSARESKEVSVTLKAPHFSINREDITVNLNPGEETTEFFNIGNDGNGLLQYNITRRNRMAGREPWTLLDSIAFGAQIDSDKLYGIAWVNGQYYVTVDGTDNNYVYAVNQDGSIDKQFNQHGGGIIGYTDITFDGELLWAVDRNTVYGFDLNGNQVKTFNSPFQSPQSLCWDPVKKVMWFAKKTYVGDQDFIATNLQGAVVQRVNRFGFDAVNSIAMFPDDPDGYTLYVSRNVSSAMAIYKIRTVPGQEDTLFVKDVSTRDSRGGLGCDITDQYENDGSWTFLTITDVLRTRGSDRIEVLSLLPYTKWMIIEPMGALSLPPGQEREVNVTLSSIGPEGRFNLPDGKYFADLVITHNAGIDEVVIPVVMNVGDNYVDDKSALAPNRFGISRVYPNPFNPVAQISYTLTTASTVQLAVYDTKGRLVEQLYSGYQHAGTHPLTWNAASKPSGVYFVRLTAGGASDLRKIVLMK